MTLTYECGRMDHHWKFVGGMNCGCEGGQCSVPVYTCTNCGDFDYGDNEEARQKRHECTLSANGLRPEDDVSIELELSQ